MIKNFIKKVMGGTILGLNDSLGLIRHRLQMVEHATGSQISRLLESSSGCVEDLRSTERTLRKQQAEIDIMQMQIKFLQTKSDKQDQTINLLLAHLELVLEEIPEEKRPKYQLVPCKKIKM